MYMYVLLFIGEIRFGEVEVGRLWFFIGVVIRNVYYEYVGSRVVILIVMGIVKLK